MPATMLPAGDLGRARPVRPAAEALRRGVLEAPLAGEFFEVRAVDLPGDGVGVVRPDAVGTAHASVAARLAEAWSCSGATGTGPIMLVSPLGR